MTVRARQRLPGPARFQDRAVPRARGPEAARNKRRAVGAGSPHQAASPQNAWISTAQKVAEETSKRSSLHDLNAHFLRFGPRPN
jgi:hypothetical protein